MKKMHVAVFLRFCGPTPPLQRCGVAEDALFIRQVVQVGMVERLCVVQGQRNSVGVVGTRANESVLRRGRAAVISSGCCFVSAHGGVKQSQFGAV